MLRVLVVDDHPEVADATAMLIATLGHEAFAVTSGADGLSVFPLYLPHVALIDIDMPGMDGWETARRIRELPDGIDIPLVAVTGNEWPKDKRKGREAGFNHRFSKPLNGDALESFLNTIALTFRCS